MQSSDRYGYAWNQDTKYVQPTQQTYASLGAESAGDTVDNRKSNADDDVKQGKVPILFSHCSPVKVGILLQNFEIPVHVCLLFVLPLMIAPGHCRGVAAASLLTSYSHSFVYRLT